MKDKLLELHNDWSEMSLKQDLDYIYHYTFPIGLDGIFVNHQLWANDIYRKNDKTEGGYILNMLKNNIDELCNVEKVRKVILKQIEELRPKLVDGFYYHEKYRTFIILVSTKPDELSLWNYYTKNKKVLVIMFNLMLIRLLQTWMLEKLKMKMDIYNSILVS